MADKLLKICGCLSPIIKEYVIDPLKVEFTLLCCSKSIFDSLRDQVQSLDNAKATLQQRVAADRRNSKNIAIEVENWLKRVDEIKTQTDIISRDISNVEQQCVNGSCLKLKLRYSISRKAMKMAKDIVDLLGDKDKFGILAHPPTPSGYEIIPGPSDPDFESRKKIEEEIMAALRDNSVYLIGICGMGGQGKTSMVEKIRQRAREENLFGAVAMAGVSQEPDQEMIQKRIQKEIADELGLTLDESMTVRHRARQLRKKLNDETRILIIIDNIWKKMDLHELGIPVKGIHGGLKIILTSRNRHVCNVTGNVTEEAIKIFPLECLPEKEAWALFKAKAGTCVADSDLHQTAKEVAKECKGLPLALVIIGGALRDRNKPSWDDALKQLQKSTPENIEGVLEQVYQPLESSYNLLGEGDQHLFLLCCLFPEGSRISLEDLLYYGFGLRIFSNIGTLREARNRVYALVENLEHCYMLMDDSKEEGIKYVKMHDVIRDMAIYIASPVRKGPHVCMISHDTGLSNRPGEDSYKNYTHISLTLNEVVELPEDVDFSALKMLRIRFQKRIRSQTQRQVPDTFFEGKKKLNVLDIGNITSLPSSLCCLENLRILRLHYGEMNDVSVICGLVTLEILDLRYSKLEVLPKEIGRLKNLKSLNLHWCDQLRKIASGVISSLKGLEELLMLYSFRNWVSEDKGQAKRNSILEEVASLKYLTALELHITCPEVLPKGKHHWQKLERYAVHMDALNKTIPLVHTLTRNASCLVLKLRGMDASNEVIRSIQDANQNLRRLSLDGCHKMEYLADRSSESIVFPILSHLLLSKCEILKGLCDEGQLLTGSFEALEHIKLVDLCKLTHLWDQKLCLPNLKEVIILNCESLQYVFLQSMSESLSRLETLVIERCTVLKEVFKAESGGSRDVFNPIEFPNLTKLTLQELPSLNSFCKALNGNESSNNSDSQYLFHQKVTFASLVELKLCKLNTATKIFSSQIPIASLSQLEKMEVIDCSNLEEVVGQEVEESQAEVEKSLFPKLKNLVLSKLPSLKIFCHMKNDIKLPQLESITIVDCCEMKIFSLGSLSLPSLSCVFGLWDPDLATQIFFKKKRDMHCESFMLSAGDLSINDSQEFCLTKYSRNHSNRKSHNDSWELCLAKDSSDNFLVVARLLSRHKLAINGSFEMEKLQPNTLYEVVFEIKLEESHFYCRGPLNLILNQSEDIKELRPEDLEHQPRGQWIEIIVGEFKTDPSPTGLLEFSLDDISIEGVFVKGVKIRSKE